MRLHAIALFCLLVGCSQNPPAPQAATPPYMVVLDAGSSGTRVYVYEIQTPKNHQDVPVIIHKGSCKSPDPRCTSVDFNSAQGIHALAGQEQKNMDAYLAPAIAYAKASIPPHFISDTQILLMATAGLRNSTIKTQEELISQTQKSLKKTFQHAQASIISGFSEGVYAWLDLNLSLKSLGKPWQETYGIIEMGGASQQITFATNNQSNSFPIQILGSRYQLYSYSYNQLGANQASHIQDHGQELEGCMAPDINYQRCQDHWTQLLKNRFDCGPFCGLLGVQQPPVPEDMHFKIIGGTPYHIAQSCQIPYFDASHIDRLAEPVCSLQSNPCPDYQGNPAYLCKLLSLLRVELFGNNQDFPGFGFSPQSTQITSMALENNDIEVSWTRGLVLATLLGISPDHNL